MRRVAWVVLVGGCSHEPAGPAASAGLSATVGEETGSGTGSGGSSEGDGVSSFEGVTTGSAGMGGGTEASGSTAGSTAGSTVGSTAGSTVGSTGSVSFCGDGSVTGDEECDAGAANDNAGACTDKCTKARCGDGYVWAGVEACDLGDAENQDGVYGGCSPNCTPNDHCGDGEIQAPHEECEGETQETEAMAECHQCHWGGRLVFVSSTLHKGAEVGGLGGADATCKALAGAVTADPERAGRFRAWLGDGKVAAPDRFALKKAPDGLPHVRVDGVKVVANFAAFAAGELLAPIDVTEAKISLMEMVEAHRVWTGTQADGTMAAEHCAGWTSLQGKGLMGTSKSSEGGWTQFSLGFCEFGRRLYCIEDGEP